MAAIIIQNPDNVPGEVTTGYQLQNTVLFAAMTGLVNVALDGLNRKIKQGSIFELNGNIVRVTADVGVSGNLTVSSSTGLCYIYAVPTNDGKVDFTFSSIVPTWNANKGGWYRGTTNERALINLITNGSIVSGVYIMSSEIDMVVPPNSGGTLVGTWNTRTHTVAHLQRGWHRFVIRSGLGRGNSAAPPSRAGGVPSIYNELTGVFFHQGGGLIIHVGGNGFNGGNGGSLNGLDAGGGGSGAGEESYIISGSNTYSTEKVRPGNNGVIEKLQMEDIYLGVTKIIRNRYPMGDGINAGGENVRISGAMAQLSTINDAGWGGFGLGNSANVPANTGASGGGGGAPGWIRNFGDTAAGYVQIWRLS